jgi:hypothetical protein
LSFEEIVESNSATCWMTKRRLQRPEHLCSTLRRHPHLYPYVFITIARFECIPLTFSEILFAIKGWKSKCVDGTLYGTYHIIVHPRGQMFGNSKGSTVKYQHGCNITYDINGIKIWKIKCRHPAFIRILKTAHQYSAVIEEEQTTQEQRLAEARKRVLRRRVLNM